MKWFVNSRIKQIRLLHLYQWFGLTLQSAVIVAVYSWCCKRAVVHYYWTAVNLHVRCVIFGTWCLCQWAPPAHLRKVLPIGFFRWAHGNSSPKDVWIALHILLFFIISSIVLTALNTCYFTFPFAFAWPNAVVLCSICFHLQYSTLYRALYVISHLAIMCWFPYLFDMFEWSTSIIWSVQHIYEPLSISRYSHIHHCCCPTSLKNSHSLTISVLNIHSWILAIAIALICTCRLF